MAIESISGNLPSLLIKQDVKKAFKVVINYIVAKWAKSIGRMCR